MVRVTSSNTRIILEPKIIGTRIGVQYKNGKLNKAINANSLEITDEVNYLRSIPKILPIINRIEIQGILYNDENEYSKNKTRKTLEIPKSHKNKKGIKFIALQIFNCNINHFQALQELKNLNFDIPQTQFTNFISDIEIYHQCWKEGELFNGYPTNGIVLKINSRKLQKQLGENNLSINWAYAINK